MSQSEFTERLLPRAMADRWFAAVCDTWPDDRERKLAEAGFFDDGLDPEVVAAPIDVRLLTTPFDKIKPTEGVERPVVLLSTGGFCPVHAGHVEMMDRARAALERLGRTVVGGYLSPGHDAYVGPKVGDGALSTSERISLMDRELESSDWLMTASWEGLYTDRALNYTDVIRHLESWLHAHVHDSVEVWYVFGADNVGFARAFVKRGRCVCVSRNDASMREVARDPAVRANSEIVFIEEPGPNYCLSSTLVRRQHRESLPELAPESWYALRDDLEWATTHWQKSTDPATLATALDSFRRGLVGAVEACFGGDAAIRTVQLSGQRSAMDMLRSAGRVIGLDPAIPADFHLNTAREFALSAAQTAARRVVARPGSDDLDEQVSRIPAGEYILADDDIATGFTMREARRLLGETRRVTSARSLLDMVAPADSARMIDVCDMRDFLLGATHAGLVVRLPNGALARALYALPWVRPASRMCCPVNRQRQLSLRVWQINFALFSQLDHLRVEDASPACRQLLSYLGYNGSDSLASVCRWHLDRLESVWADLDEGHLVPTGRRGARP